MSGAQREYWLKDAIFRPSAPRAESFGLFLFLKSHGQPMSWPWEWISRNTCWLLCGNALLWLASDVCRLPFLCDEGKTDDIYCTIAFVSCSLFALGPRYAGWSHWSLSPHLCPESSHLPHMNGKFLLLFTPYRQESRLQLLLRFFAQSVLTPPL